MMRAFKGQKQSQVQKRGAVWWGPSPDRPIWEDLWELQVIISCHLDRVILGIATFHHMVRARVERAWRNVPYRVHVGLVCWPLFRLLVGSEKISILASPHCCVHLTLSLQ